MNFIDINISIDEINFEIHAKKGRSNNLIKRDKLVIPRSLSMGNRLVFIRNTLSFIIKDYNVLIANINSTESSDDIIGTIKIEAVIEELLSSSGVEICK